MSKIDFSKIKLIAFGLTERVYIYEGNYYITIILNDFYGTNENNI